MASTPQLNSMKKQRAFAWAKFYEQVTHAHEFNTQQWNRMDTLRRQAEDAAAEVPKHICDELLEMTSQLKSKIECPICLDVIQADLKITMCGHKYCSTCFAAIDKCAICRKKIYKK